MTPLEQAYRNRDVAMVQINAERARIAVRRAYLHRQRNIAATMVILSPAIAATMLLLVVLFK